MDDRLNKKHSARERKKFTFPSGKFQLYPISNRLKVVPLWLTLEEGNSKIQKGRNS